MEPSCDPEIGFKAACLYARKTMGDRAINAKDAEDIAQESLLRLMESNLPLKYSRNRAMFLVRDCFKTETRRKTKTSYLCEVPRNLRKHSHSNNSACLHEFFESGMYPERFKTIVGYVMQGKTLKEVARLLGVSVTLVHWYVRKYRNRLKEDL